MLMLLFLSIYMLCAYL